MRKYFSKLVVLLVVASSVGWIMAMTSASFQSDPCSIYPHKSALVTIATPTQKLIAGVLNQQIYICSVTVSQAVATPGLTLSYGEVVAATPCATATPGASLGVYGGPANTTTQYGNGNFTYLGPVPAAVGTPVVDVCSLTTTILGGTVNYVQQAP